MIKKFFLFLFIFVIFSLSLSFGLAFAQNQAPKEERFEAVIESLEKSRIIDPEGREKQNISYKLKGTTGKYKEKKFEVENKNVQILGNINYEVNDKVIVAAVKGLENKDVFLIEDYVRRDSLAWLFIIFFVLTIIVGRKTGMGSLIGMGVSFFVIFTFILPQIMSGKDPVLITIIASILIIPVTYYLSHGFNNKTHIAIAGTIIALIISGLLANFFILDAKLTGFVSEEAGFLRAAKQDLVDIRGLLLAGIIIGLIGVIDDVTVSQSAIVFQLKEASSKLSLFQLFSKAMKVGKDHIASMVNTLVLVYTGASLPLLLLFINNPSPFLQVINHEIIAEEIIRTLVGSIGLVLAVPITTFIAALFTSKISQNDKS